MHDSSNLFQQPMWHLLPLAGSSETDIQQKYIALTQYVQQHPHVPLGQLASLLGQEDTENTFRKAVIANDISYLVKQFANNDIKEIAPIINSRIPRTVFMLPGIGDHYVQMGQGLYAAIPYFREIINECDAALRPFLSDSLVDLLYPPEPTSQENNIATSGFDLAAMLGRKPTAGTENPQEAQLRETVTAHPLVFSIEYALAKLLQQWGIHPHGLIGYSLGEYVAATISGVLTVKDALSLVAQRAQIIQTLPQGKMLATPLSKEAVKSYLSKTISLSAHNGDSLTVLAGEAEAILAVQQQLLDQQIACRILEASHAFHSHMMEQAAASLTNLAQSITFAPPQIPYLSNVTGEWITARQAMDPTYWAQHMCQPVQCFTMLRNLLGKEQIYHLIEVGPGQSLGSFAKQHPQCKREQYSSIYPTLRYSYDRQDDHWFLLSTIRKLWLSGLNLHWEKISPTYSDVVSKEMEHLLTFASNQSDSQRPLQQKNRGRKRRTNRLRRRSRHING